MRIRPFLAVVVCSNAVLIFLSLHNQLRMTTSLTAIKYSLDLFAKQQDSIVRGSEKITLINRSIREDMGSLSGKVRHLIEISRRNYIRIQGIQEKADENLEEKVSWITNINFFVFSLLSKWYKPKRKKTLICLWLLFILPTFKIE